jgi:hypothetical protein
MENKRCSKCEKTLALNDENFVPRKIGKIGWYAECRACRNKNMARYMKKKRQQEPGIWAESDRKTKEKLKAEVFEHYCPDGIKCAKCPFTDLRALTIDHINGDGYKHTFPSGKRMTGAPLYRWIKKHNYPKDLQVLCMNCQWIKRHENQEHNHKQRT